MRTVRIPRGAGCIGTARAADRDIANEQTSAHDRGATIQRASARAVLDDVLGDLSEERNARALHDGPVPAAWWYVRELTRSVPHVALASLRDALRTRRGRTLVLAIGGAGSTLCVLIAVAVATRPIPTKLGLGVNDTVVVNNEPPRAFRCTCSTTPDEFSMPMRRVYGSAASPSQAS